MLATKSWLPKSTTFYISLALDKEQVLAITVTSAAFPLGTMASGSQSYCTNHFIKVFVASSKSIKKIIYFPRPPG